MVDAIEGPGVRRGGYAASPGRERREWRVVRAGGLWTGPGCDDLRDRSCGGSSGCRRGLIELGQLPRRTNPRPQPAERFGREPTRPVVV